MQFMMLSMIRFCIIIRCNLDNGKYIFRIVLIFLIFIFIRILQCFIWLFVQKLRYCVWSLVLLLLSFIMSILMLMVIWIKIVFWVSILRIFVKVLIWCVMLMVVIERCLIIIVFMFMIMFVLLLFLRICWFGLKIFWRNFKSLRVIRMGLVYVCGIIVKSVISILVLCLCLLVFGSIFLVNIWSFCFGVDVFV